MAAAPGNNYAGNAKVAKAALERALEARSRIERKDMLEAIWDAQITAALSGERDSAQLIIERLDGKPQQSIDAVVDASITIEVVKFADSA